MNIAEQLPDPLNTFVLDVPANEYYDFELPTGSTYPLCDITVNSNPIAINKQKWYNNTYAKSS